MSSECEKPIFIEQASSINNAKHVVEAINGPALLIIDLRDDNNEFTGLDWLINKLSRFLRGHASTVPFVISGQLNDMTINELSKRGIKKQHTFDKGKWFQGDSDRFKKIFKDALQNLNRIAVANISKGTSGSNIDPYIRHELLKEKYFTEHTNEAGKGTSKPKEYPLLIKSRYQNWDHNKIRNLKVLGKVGNYFSCLGTKETIEDLSYENSLSVEISRSTTLSESYVAPSSKITSNTPQAVNMQHKYPEIKDEKGDLAIVGIIDSGIDIFHESFRDENGQTRILSVWDQHDQNGPAPQGLNFALGTEYTAEQINSYISNPASAPKVFKNTDPHGTQVTSIATGRPSGTFSGGTAPEAKIVIVIASMDGRSLGYSNNYPLALEYIKSIGQRKNLPVAINISQGMNAGAHDGTSSLEKACDIITDNGDFPGLAIVKSAGNLRGGNYHAKIRLEAGYHDHIGWQTQDKPGEDLIELWFESNQKFKLRLKHPNDNQQGPDGITNWVSDWVSDWVNHQKLRTDKLFSTGELCTIDLTPYIKDNGDSRVLIRISSPKRITSGKWILEIDSKDCYRYGDIHAWIERDDRRQTQFTNHLSDKVTLSIPGTAQYVISVGSISEELSSSPFSSLGPTRDGRPKPELVAIGEGVEVAKSGTAQAAEFCSGTSMAAPQVTGAIACLFSAWHKEYPYEPQLNAAQIQKAISQLSQNHTGYWHRGVGFGVLDKQKFLEEVISILDQL